MSWKVMETVFSHLDTIDCLTDSMTLLTLKMTLLYYVVINVKHLTDLAITLQKLLTYIYNVAKCNLGVVKFERISLRLSPIAVRDMRGVGELQGLFGDL